MRIATPRNGIGALFLLFTLLLFAPHLPAAQENSGAAKPAGEYRIGIGDQLDVVAWREPDLSRQVTVRMDGKVTLPLINDVQAAGRTPSELKAEIERKAREFVADVIVTVSVQLANSQRFYILGEVVRTGEYPITKDLTVLQAFALAGGFTQWASKKEIILLRREGGLEKAHLVNYKKMVNDQDFSQNIPIRADDTIIVP
jgi:polysaccharide export outer membrane protein